MFWPVPHRTTSGTGRAPHNDAPPAPGLGTRAGVGALADRSCGRSPRDRAWVHSSKSICSQLPATNSRIRNDGQRPCPRDGGCADSGQIAMERIVTVTFKIKRNVKVADQTVLDEPRCLVDHPAHERVLRHPVREGSLASDERHAAARADSTQLYAEFVAKKGTEGLPKCGALRIARVVIRDAVTQGLGARWKAVGRRTLRADSGVEKKAAIPNKAPICVDLCR